MAILRELFRMAGLFVILCIFESQSYMETTSGDVTTSPTEHDGRDGGSFDGTTTSVNGDVPTNDNPNVGSTTSVNGDDPTNDNPKVGSTTSVNGDVPITDNPKVGTTAVTGDPTNGTMADINGKVFTTDNPLNQTVVSLINKTVTSNVGNVSNTDVDINNANMTYNASAVANETVTSQPKIDNASVDAGKCAPFYCCDPFLSDRDRHNLKKRQETLFSMITYFWISLFLCLGGLVGNILSFIVLYRQKINSSVFFLKCLAVSDGLYMLWYLVFDLYYTAYMDTQWITNRNEDSVHVIPANKIYLSFANATLTLLSSWLVVLLTVDRFIIVRMPLMANSLCTLNKARIEAFVLFVCCVGFCLPILWQYTSSIERHLCWDYLVMYKDPTPFGSTYGNFFVYNVVLSGLIKNLFPVLIVFIMNILLIIGLMEASARRRKLVSDGKEAQKRDENISLMLITVAVLYLILLLPSLGLKVLRSLWMVKTYLKLDLNIDDKYFDSIGFYAMVSDLLIRVNSAINFIIYVLVSKKFRDGLMKLLCCKRGSKADLYKTSVTRTTSFGKAKKEET